MANHSQLLKLSGLTNSEISEIKLNTQIIVEILIARKGDGIGQQELEEIIGVK